MEVIDIVAFVILGFVGLILIGIAVELSILVAAGAAIYSWFVIFTGGGSDTIWILAIVSTLLFFGLGAIFSSPSRR